MIREIRGNQSKITFDMICQKACSCLGHWLCCSCRHREYRLELRWVNWTFTIHMEELSAFSKMSAWKFDYTWWAYGSDSDHATHIHNAKHFHGFDAVACDAWGWEQGRKKEETMNLLMFSHWLCQRIYVYVLWWAGM